MDVLVGDNPNVLTVVDILNRQSIPPTEKRINHFLEFNGFVYISTGFGISLFSLTDLEFDDTYFIGDNGSRLNVVQMAILDEFIYAATTDFGIRVIVLGHWMLMRNFLQLHLKKMCSFLIVMKTK